MATVSNSHIEVDDQGVARIAGETTRVSQVIADYKYWGWTPDMIHRQYPYLSLAQIHAAFVYYYDHQKAIDDLLDEEERYVEKMRAQSQETSGRQKLRDLGLKP